MTLATDLGTITFSPDDETWIEYGPPRDRRRVGFHDYAALYAVPGLYERVFHDELEMRSADVVVGLYADALRTLDRTAADERVLDLGAGTGIGGTLLRELGVGQVTALDVEPAAADAAARDRPGVYDAFLVADLGASPETLEALAADRPTALLAISAIGAGHIALELLAETVTRVLRPGGLFGFAVAAELLPAFFEEFFALVDADRLYEHAYVHRRRTDGSAHEATAVLARRR